LALLCLRKEGPWIHRVNCSTRPSSQDWYVVAGGSRSRSAPALFALYYGYILLIAADRELLSRRIGDATTLGIPIGAGVIVGAWVLTFVYVVWANRHYDPEVERLKRRLTDVDGP